MPTLTIRELQAQAEKLAAELGKTVRTVGLTHAALTELVEGLQEELAAQALKNPGGDAPKSPEPKIEEPRGEIPRTYMRPPPAAAPAEPSAPTEPPADAPARVAEPARPEPPQRPVVTIDGATGEAAAPAPAPEPPPPSGYSVAPGRSITSLRGILVPRTVVTPADFFHGQETIDDLVSKGILRKG